MMGGPHVNIDKREANIPADFRRKFPRACPREGCGSLDLKFMYFIRHKTNKNLLLTQPRYECNGCKKGFTRGGSLQRAAVAATARPAAKVRHRLVLMSSSSAESRSSERSAVEASAAERDEARVGAEESAKELPDDERNSEGRTGGEAREAQITAAAQVEVDSEDNLRTPAQSVDATIAKMLLREKIKKHLCNAGIVLLEIQVEKYALQACHIHGESDELCSPTDREICAVERMERMQRDMFVAAARVVKAERGIPFEYSPYRYFLIRQREEEVMEAEEAVETMQGQVENMKIDRVSHSELVEMEKKAQQLREHVDGLNDYD